MVHYTYKAIGVRHFSRLEKKTVYGWLGKIMTTSGHSKKGILVLFKVALLPEHKIEISYSP